MLAVITLSVSSNLPYRVKVPSNQIMNLFNSETCHIILLNCENFVVVFTKKKKEVKHKNDRKKFANYSMTPIGMTNQLSVYRIL